MRNLYFTLPAICAVALSCVAEQVENTVPSEPAAPVQAVLSEEFDPTPFSEPGIAIVLFDQEMTDRIEAARNVETLKTRAGDELSALLDEMGVSHLERLFPYAGEYEKRTRREGLHRWYVVEYDQNVSVTRAGNVLREIPGVQEVEPSLKTKPLAFTPNDTYWSRLWGLYNSTYKGYDVNCVPVWEEFTMGNPNVVVGVVDGGLQLNHPDLQANIASSGHYNYVNSNATITAHDHGTHVGGTISAVGNNRQGVIGVAGGNSSAGKPGVKLLSLQVFETRDGKSYSARSFATAIKEGADKGAIISQNSWGNNFDFDDNGEIEGQELEYAIYYHQHPQRDFVQAVDYFNKYAGCDNNGNQLSSSPMKGGVVIFAAGNDHIQYSSPGSYDACISVGAISQNGARAYFSNWGDWVDICAPGYSIISTVPGNNYAQMSGTSMACPHVSGVAALIVSHFGGRGFTADELKARLLNGAKKINASSGANPIGPLVNAYGSFMVQADQAVPSSIGYYTSTAVGHNIRLDFTSNGAYGYMAYASTSESSIRATRPEAPGSGVITATNIVATTENSGQPMSITLSGLTQDTQYYVAVAAFNYNREYSPMSAVQSIRTMPNAKPQITVQSDNMVYRHYQMVDLPFIISDPDGDEVEVTFTTTGRAQLVQEQDLWRFKLMCPLVLSTGRAYTAQVTATDELGASATKSFNYTVLANVAPVLSKPLESVSFAGAESEPIVVDLKEFFTDEDGEPLTFRVSVDKNGIADLDLDEETGSLLTVKPLSTGQTNVSISAADGDGAIARGSFKLSVRSSDSPVSIGEGSVISGNSLTVVPGPEAAETSVRILTMAGAVVYQGSKVCSASDPFVLDVSKLAPGIYRVEITYLGQTTVQTIVRK